MHQLGVGGLRSPDPVEGLSSWTTLSYLHCQTVTFQSTSPHMDTFVLLTRYNHSALKVVIVELILSCDRRLYM